MSACDCCDSPKGKVRLYRMFVVDAVIRFCERHSFHPQYWAGGVLEEE